MTTIEDYTLMAIAVSSELNKIKPLFFSVICLQQDWQQARFVYRSVGISTNYIAAIKVMDQSRFGNFSPFIHPIVDSGITFSYIYNIKIWPKFSNNLNRTIR